MADNLLDKASILLTPTAYNDGSMLSVKPENGDGDFTFSRGSAATRVNAQGLVENVQIISPELVSNGNFSQIGTEEVLNGNFSQESSELITNGDFATDSDWTLTQATISNGSANFATTDGSFAGIRQTVFTTGKTYLISLDVSNLVGTIEVNTNGGTSIGLDITTNGTKSFYMKAENIDIEIKRKFGAEQVISATIDNVSVKEVGQNWSLGTGWSIGDDKAVATNATGNLLQTNVFTIGKTYKIVYTINEVTSGNGVRVKCGSTNGIVRNTEGTYVEYLTCTGSAHLFIDPNISFNGSITNISVKEVGQDWSFVSGATIGDNKAIISGDGSVAGLIEQTSVFSSGKTYKITLDAVINSGGGLNVKYGIAFADNIGSILTTGSYTFYYTAPSTKSLIIARKTGGVAYDSTITNISVKEITDDTDIPRIDYTDGCGSWLLEPQSTNLLTYSEDFSNSYWTKSSVTLTSGYLAPDGTLNAFKVSGGGILSTNPPTSQTTTRSIYARTVSGTGTAQLLSHNSNTNNIFTITEQWQRFDLNTSGLTGFNNFYGVDFRGVGTLSEIILWGANATDDQSYATSYIPTNGAIATRLADVATNSGNSTLINSTEGVLYAEIAALADDGTNKYITINNGGTADYLFFRYRSDNNFQVKLRSANTDKVNQTLTLSDNLDLNKIAFSYKQNEFKIFVNGSQIGSTITTGATSSANTLNKIDLSSYDGASNFIGKAKAIAVYKEALTDAQLQALTTI